MSKKCPHCKEGFRFFKCCAGRECDCRGDALVEECEVCNGTGFIGEDLDIDDIDGGED